MTRPLHVGHFFGPLVDQQHDQLDVGIVRRDALADVLQEDRLAGSRRGDDQRPLALAQRREQVHHPRRQRLGAGFQLQPGLGIDRRQLVEGLDVAVVLGRHAVDVERSRAAAGPCCARPGCTMPLMQHALAEAVLLDHAAGHERIGQLAGVVVVRVAEETVAVGVHFQHAAAGLERAGLAVVGRSVGEGDALVVVGIRRRAVPRLRTEAVVVVFLLHAGDASAVVVIAGAAAFLSLTHDHNPFEIPLRRVST